MANFCSNNSDGRIWAFYSTYLTLDMDNPGIGLIHFVRKLLFLLKWTLFLAWPHIKAIQSSCQLCSNIDDKDSWAHQILQRARSYFKRPIKLCNLHGFE